MNQLFLYHVIVIVYENNKLSSNPILTFDIFLNGSDTEISGNYMCQYIGILKTTHNEMKDIFCGPSYILE